MDIVKGNNQKQIAGNKIGDTVLILLVTGKLEKVVLSDITRTGIEGFEVNLKNRPLTFYPFNAIIKVTKYTEIE